MMKKIYFFILTGLFHLTTFAQSNYTGNGQNGFGGTIGTSSLSVSDDGTTATFTLTRGSANLNDFFVIYFDSQTGGFANTTGFNDQNDANRKAISGASGATRTDVTFPGGFTADFAVSVGTGFAGMWGLANGGNNSLPFVKSLGTPPTATFTTYTFTITKTELGIPSGNSFAFNFNLTYVSSTAFRSNEGYGGGLPGTNPGSSAVTFSDFKSYPLIVTPLNLNTFTGAVKNETIELKWSTVSETNLAKFVVQKSSNGLNFYDIAEVDPKNLTNGANYSYIDNSLNIGNNFYRIIARNNVGEKAFSKVIRLLYGKIDNNLTLFPNPTREFLKINFMTAVRGNYKLDIYNDAGQKLITQQFDHNGIDKIINITLPTSMKKGPYRVYISNQYEFYKGTFIVQ